MKERIESVEGYSGAYIEVGDPTKVLNEIKPDTGVFWGANAFCKTCHVELDDRIGSMGRTREIALDKVNERMYCAGNYCTICGNRLKDELITPPKQEATP